MDLINKYYLHSILSNLELLRLKKKYIVHILNSKYVLDQKNIDNLLSVYLVIFIHKNYLFV